MTNRYIMDWEKYTVLARQAAAEGVVLLRNENNTLPLREGEKISVFGRIQFNYYKSGTGSGGLVNTRYTVGILDALVKENLHLNQEIDKIYQDWIKEHPFDQGKGWAQEPWSQEEMPLTDELVCQAAKESDTAIVVIGRTAGEDRDIRIEKGSYLLTSIEEDMLEKVCSAFSKTVILLNVGSIIDMKWVEKYKPSAVMYVWQGGQEGGNGVVDVLMGRVNPCGKLTDTIAYDIHDYPSTKNFGGEQYNEYEEDIYVGYRYFETFEKEKVMYPFGYGLSYTSFHLQQPQVKREELEDLKCCRSHLQVSVVNTGQVSGKEVVQVYLKAPQGKLGKPLRSLVAFKKTKLLSTRESEQIDFLITDSQLASYDDEGKTGHPFCYVLEPGYYEFYIGTDVRNAISVGGFDIKELIVVEECTQVAAPEKVFSRLRPNVLEEKEGVVEALLENAPIKISSMKSHIENDKINEISYTGNKGYFLSDVYDGKIDLNTFVAQISDQGLCCIVKGEGMCSPKVTPGTAAAFGGLTEELKELGIPCGCCADGPSGIRMDCGTKAFSLPNGVCLASTFNETLLEDLFEMVGAELRKNRVDTLLGPGMNIHRNPLNGRNFEYFSEDPLVTGKIASAQLRGMKKYGIHSTIKHFAANNQEHNRRKYNSIVSERALREIYLKGFEIAVKEGNAKSVMTTYGAVNGVWTAGNYDLVTTILRKEWGFDGMVMTDWWADINDEGGLPSVYNYTAMVKAQNDVFMVVPDTEKLMGNLLDDLENGSLTRGALQRCAMNILNMLLHSPVMERQLGRISKEEKEAYESIKEEEKVDFDLIYHQVDGEIILSGEELCTEKGNSVLYGLEILKPGEYKLCMKVKADAGEVAQIPVSIFLNGTLLGTITINGTNEEWIEIEQNLGVIFSPHNYIRLYFAQSGMKIDAIKIIWTKPLDKPDWME